MTGRKYLAVNADDFGFTRDVNRGIVEAHRNGILTSTTLMANGDAYEDAVELARANPKLDIGCHFVLIGGQSLLSPFSAYPATVAELLRAIATRRMRVEDELRAQLERIRSAGIRLTHVDTHKHTHLLPPVLSLVARLARESGICWVRRPFDLPLTGPPSEVPWKIRAVSRSMHFLRRRFHTVLGAEHCKTTDYFAGFQVTGRFHAAQLVRILEALPEGTTEFMCHPGFCTEELRGARTRLKESREEELQALLDPTVCEALRKSGIELKGFGELP